ncbi:MAG: hypothetical protein PHY54_06015 [Methylococcales bacterium]|nr:hypothetical protein [Methylococcales bacterium]
MSKADFIPHPDNDLLTWHDRFKATLTERAAEFGLSAQEVAAIDNDNQNLHAKITAAALAAANARHATSEKADTHAIAEANARALARRIKSHPAYTEATGTLFGIVGSEVIIDLTTAKPILYGIDQTGGIVSITYQKSISNGVNIYGQLETESQFTLLARNTLSPYIDSRPLLVAGKPELRRYSAVYVLNDKEIGLFSDELVINCAP